MVVALQRVMVMFMCIRQAGLWRGMCQPPAVIGAEVQQELPVPDHPLQLPPCLPVTGQFRQYGCGRRWHGHGAAGMVVQGPQRLLPGDGQTHERHRNQQQPCQAPVAGGWCCACWLHAGVFGRNGSAYGGPGKPCAKIAFFDRKAAVNPSDNHAELIARCRRAQAEAAHKTALVHTVANKGPKAIQAAMDTAAKAVKRRDAFAKQLTALGVPPNA